MNRPVRILELRSVRGTGGGPEKTILLGAARSDPDRFAITVCYLRDGRDSIFGVDRKAAELPVDYIEIVEKHSFDRTIFTRLRRIVRERAIDIVHAHEYKTDALAWLLGRFERVVPLATAHGWTGDSPRERLAYYPLDKWLLSRFPAVISVSSDVRAELLRHGADPVRVITVLNGIDHVAFGRDRGREGVLRRELGIAPGDIVIGAVGRLETQKRFDLLLDAFAELARDRPDVTLLIVGDGSLKEALTAQIARLHLGDRCRLLGHRTDVVDLHHSFDLLVQSSDYEGTPNAVLEAMALETPVVATAAGGTDEILRHGIDGLVVPIGERTALVDAMRDTLDKRAAARDRAASARRRVETDLSFDTRMKTVESIYLDLMNHRPPSGAASALAARI